MNYLLIRHKVADFEKWKLVYDGHGPARQKAGLKEVQLLRSVDDPNEVVLLFEADDLDAAREFGRSADLHDAMQRSGVVDKPDVCFLSK
jgi:heme-degrading monooxygenase HmoA